MSKKNLAAIAFMCLLNFNCKKESAPTIDVSKITEADNLGNLMGQQDITDWTFDNSWSNTEKNLFETPESSVLNNTITTEVTNDL